MEKSFSQWKRQCLNKLDQSKKGSVDEDITDLVALLNGCEQFFTTSSCSGRIILIDGATDSSDVQKQNCVWLFVSHQKCKSDDLIDALSQSSGDAVLKFEPFVLHVQCRKLEDAQLMHSVAINSGFRNSGLTISKTGKIITAVRSTHGLEVPLSHQGKVVVEHEYIKYLSEIANQKMEENLRRINRFYQNLQSALAAEKLQKLQIPGSPVSQHRTNKDSCNSQETQNREKKQEETEKRNNGDVYRRRRKREQLKTDCCHGDEDNSLPELDECLDLFT